LNDCFVVLYHAMQQPCMRVSQCKMMAEGYR